MRKFEIKGLVSLEVSQLGIRFRLILRKSLVSKLLKSKFHPKCDKKYYRKSNTFYFCDLVHLFHLENEYFS